MPDETKQREGLHPAFIAGVVLVLAFLDFVLQNTDEVRVHFLFLETDKPLWLLLLITSAIAVGAVEIVAFVLRRRRD